MAGTGCRGCGAPVKTNDRVFQYTAGGWQGHSRLDRQAASRTLRHGCAASGTQCSHQQLAPGLRAGLPADDGAPNCIYCTPNTYAETGADALGGDARTAATEAHTKEAAQKHTPAPNPQGEGSGMSPTAYALTFKTALVDFAQAFPGTARSAPTAGRAAHHPTAYHIRKTGHSCTPLG
jgi:hypothetical protein